MSRYPTRVVKPLESGAPTRIGMPRKDKAVSNASRRHVLPRLRPLKVPAHAEIDLPSYVRRVVTVIGYGIGYCA